VFRLEAIRRAYRELEIVHRTQQDRIYRRSLLFLDRRSRPFERRENGKLIDEDPRCVADRLLGFDHAVRLYVDDELVQIGTLLHSGRFDRIGHAPDGRERRIEYDLADPLGFLGDYAEIPGDVSAAVLHLDLHLDLTPGRQM